MVEGDTTPAPDCLPTQRHPRATAAETQTVKIPPPIFGICSRGTRSDTTNVARCASNGCGR